MYLPDDIPVPGGPQIKLMSEVALPFFQKAAVELRVQERAGEDLGCLAELADRLGERTIELMAEEVNPGLVGFLALTGWIERFVHSCLEACARNLEEKYGS